ncbi:MAG TPA: iron-sulfur cluster-binding domain-containing protein [Stellaceae bacterium]|nr:iron-sulfur cluster-binding domain-containing protein [Stellaceae bacterium]
MLAMGYRLRHLRADFHLHYSTRSPPETAFLPEVMAVFAGRLTMHHDGREPAKGIDLTAVLKTPAPEQHLYICGPPGLLDAARAAASHWPAGTVHYELFTSTRAPNEIAALREEAGDESFVVELRKSGLTLTVPAGRSILKVLLDHKIDILYACEEGVVRQLQDPLSRGQGRPPRRISERRRARTLPPGLYLASGTRRTQTRSRPVIGGAATPRRAPFFGAIARHVLQRGDRGRAVARHLGGDKAVIVRSVLDRCILHQDAGNLVAPFGGSCGCHSDSAPRRSTVTKRPPIAGDFSMKEGPNCISTTLRCPGTDCRCRVGDGVNIGRGRAHGLLRSRGI